MTLENEELARRVAKETIAEFLLTLGIDADEPLEVQKDLAFVRKQRVTAEALTRHGFLVAIGLFVTGTVGAVWAAIKTH